MKINFKFAFSMAEGIVTLAILGVIAAMLIPSIAHNSNKARNKSKIQTAAQIYEEAMMTIRNDNIRGISNSLLSDMSCGDYKAYFKAVESDGECKFKTSNGIWWDFTNKPNAIVGISKDDLTADKANDADKQTAFYLVTAVDSNSKLRINDRCYEYSNAYQKDATAKLYAFISDAKGDLACGGDINNGDSCTCNGPACCHTHCNGARVCVENNRACVATTHLASCAGAAVHPWGACVDLRADAGCVSEKYVYDGRDDYMLIQHNGNTTQILTSVKNLDSECEDTKEKLCDWNDEKTFYYIITLTKKADGTVEYRIDSPYDGGAINGIIFDKNGEVIAFRNYDRKDCTRTNCPWETNPFEYYDTVKYGGRFKGCAKGPAAMGYCDKDTPFTGRDDKTAAIVKTELEKMLGMKD